MDKRILVTGGAGFIGSHLADAFLADGWEVAIIDDLSTGKRHNVPARAKLFPCDVRSAAAAEVVAEVRPRVICHHAAQMDVRRSMSDPQHDAGVNLLGLLNLLEAAVKVGGVDRFVFASSGGATYGDTDVVPTPESHPQQPVSNYGASKAASEIYLGVYRAVYGLRSTCLRYANVYGPRQDPHGEAGVVAIFAGRLLAGQRCRIFGDGGNTRDYVFVGDVVRANLLAVQKGIDGAFNVGTGVETDVNRLLALLAAAGGFPSGAEYALAKLGEQRRSCLDVSRAESLLGWKPQVSLAQGLAQTIEWFRARR
jgi:UDP-glucose 4-epimerase